MKWLLRIGLIVVLLVVIAGVAAFIMIDSIATAAVQKGAAFATETDVEVEKVDVKVFGAAATITGLDIKNPEGAFRETFDSFLKLGDASAEVSAGSVMSDKIVIPKVELSDIEITLIGRDGKKNYEAILASLKRFQGDTPPEESEDGKEYEITLTTISRITVKYDFDEDPVLGAPIEGTVEIAFDEPIVLENLGQGGVPMSQITADLITDIMIQITANMGAQIGDHVLGLTGSLAETLGPENLNAQLEDLGLELDVSAQLGKFKELGGDLGEGIGNVIEGGGEIIKDLGGGILGGDKDKEGEEEEGGGVLEGLNPF